MKSNLNKYNNLTQRLIAGILGSFVLIMAVSYGSWWYFAIFLGLCVLAQLEFYKLLGLDGNAPLQYYGTFCGSVFYTIAYLNATGQVGTEYYFLFFPLLSCIFLIKLYKKQDKKPFTNIAFTFLGIIYVAFPISLIHYIAYSGGNYSWQIVLGMLLILWSSDTGAYFAGTYLGKRKLFERVSPKKSWEGMYGGAALALTMAMSLSYYFHDLEVYEWAILAVIMVIGGTYGDLVESLFKRSISIKDSGSIIPGHGGFLDRFDGLLLAAPFVACYVMLLR